MTETSYLWDNPGTGDSPALGYGHAELMEEMFRMLWNGTGNRGVLRGWLNELADLTVTGVDADPTIDSGGAISYGFAYENIAPVTIVGCPNGVSEIVVRVSWAAQTARLTNVLALVQNPGVTYDIPILQVTKALGVVTGTTDTREFCEYTTDLQDDVVETDHIQGNAVTTAKLENQTRWLFRGTGMLEPDPGVGAGATWTSNTTRVPYNDAWYFDPAANQSVWLTFIVPSDYTSGTAQIYVWNMLQASTGSADVIWGWNSWDAQPSAVLAAQAGTETIDQTGRLWDEMHRDEITVTTPLVVAAGDIFHIQVGRNGAAGGDTEPIPTFLHMVEIVYTADS